jgi:hypothetical protein
MDINKLISETKAKFNHNLAKSYLKEKYQNSLIFADQNGLWKATPELLSLLESSKVETLILIDTYENPVKVHRESLLQKAHNIYLDATEEYYNEWVELRKQR